MPYTTDAHGIQRDEQGRVIGLVDSDGQTHLQPEGLVVSLNTTAEQYERILRDHRAAERQNDPRTPVQPPSSMPLRYGLGGR